MIDFMYTGDYSIAEPQPAAKSDTAHSTPILFFGSTQPAITTIDDSPAALSTSQELLVHTAVYVLAEEKDIPKLKVLAKEKYEKALPNGWNSAEFCTSLRQIYEETPESDHLLWDVAINWAGKKAKELMDRGEFVELWREKADLQLAVFRTYVSLQGSKVGTATAVSSTSSKFTNIFGSLTSTRMTSPKPVVGTCPFCHDSDDVSASDRGRRRWWCSSCNSSFN